MFSFKTLIVTRLWLIPSLWKVLLYFPAVKYKTQFCILFAASFKIRELKWNLKSMNGTYRKVQIFGCHFVKSHYNMDIRFCTCRVDWCCHQTQRTYQILMFFFPIQCIQIVMLILNLYWNILLQNICIISRHRRLHIMWQKWEEKTVYRWFFFMFTQEQEVDRTKIFPKEKLNCLIKQ